MHSAVCLTVPASIGDLVCRINFDQLFKVLKMQDFAGKDLDSSRF